MARKAPSDPTFHPSRDQPHNIGDVTASGQGVLLDQGEAPSRLDLFGSQGRMGNQSRLRLIPPGVSHTEREHEPLENLMKDVGRYTTVPTTHWTRDQEDVLVSPKSIDQAGGYYRHPYAPGMKPMIGVETSPFTDSTKTMVHEMGHAHHYATVTGQKERGNPSKIYQDRRGMSPDPLKEAVADAYVDRYGGDYSAHSVKAQKHQGDVEFNDKWAGGNAPPEPDKFGHISDRQFGYSSQYEADRGGAAVWDSPDRVLYAGTRAHFGETGDIPRYQQPPGNGMPGSATDATIAHLHEHSPHAREAWEQLNIVGPETDEGFMGDSRSMTDVAEVAVRRHKDRKLLSEGQFVQESLFGEPEMAYNQQGETPRTARDLQGTLGPREAGYWDLKEKGFKGDFD